MAREWQPNPAPDIRQTNDGLAGLATGSWALDRNWSARRGVVLWEGHADLSGSFPGFAHWGSRAQGVQVTLTDHFLLVNDATDNGFGLPLGWLSAAHALTGVEPVAMESGDHVRICYVDQNRVRGFMVRIRGGRFGARSGRRANQFRAAALSLGLASATPARDLLLPPEHDLALDWADFAAYEAEPVVWTGRVAMPVGSGLEMAASDVWLTEASLIWGARARAGIYRVDTSALVAVTSTMTPAHEPVVYWSVGGSHQTVVDLPMILPRSGPDETGAAGLASLIDVLAGQGHLIAGPAAAPRPWHAPVDLILAPAQVVPIVAVGSQSLESASSGPTPTTDMDTADEPSAVVPVPPGSLSRRSEQGDDPLPSGAGATRPSSAPRPWGERVERVERTISARARPASQSGSFAAADLPGTADGPVADRLRIWPPAVPRRQTLAGATPMLVRRPPARATSTEEFLASERAAREAARQADETGSPAGTPQVTASAVGGTADDRGIVVRFRRPQGVAELTDEVTGASVTSTAYPASAVTDDGAEQVDGSHATPSPRVEDAGPLSLADRSNVTVRATVADGPVADANATGGEPSATVAADATAETNARPSTATDTLPADDAPPLAIPANVEPETMTAAVVLTSVARPSHLGAMRTALAALDGQLAVVLHAIGRPGEARDVALAPTAPHLKRALSALDLAVGAGEIGARAAATQRQAVTRTADTTERLRSLLDLHSRGYLSASDLEARRAALLGRGGENG